MFHQAVFQIFHKLQFFMNFVFKESTIFLVLVFFMVNLLFEI